jgi:hypothetical protein
MATYPGNKIEILDGQLQPIATIPEDTVLVIDRALSGPTNIVYYVSDLKQASIMYGAESPLIRKASQAFNAGARNVALYRYGGQAAQILNLFGQDTSIETTAQSVVASDNLYVYIGPEPNSPSVDCILVTRGSKLIYSDTVSTPLTSSVVTVQGFSKTDNSVYVGSYYTPVPFSEVAAEAGTLTSFTGVIASNTVALGVGYDDTKVSSYSKLVKLNDVRLEPTEYSIAGTTLTVPNAVDGDTITYSYVTKYTFAEILAKGIEYSAGTDSLDAGYREQYELLDTALRDLDLVSAKAILVGDLHGVANVFTGFVVPQVGGVYADPDTYNALTYLSILEDDDGELVYKWSPVKKIYRDAVDPQATTTNSNAAAINANGEPIVVESYSAVDFVHRLGMWAYERAVDGLFPNVIVGAKGPANLSKAALNTWVGKAPVKDLQGNIIENGTGLLGHTLAVGTTLYAGGYYATANGFVDGDVLVDSGQFPVDLGKYLSVVPSQVTLLTTGVPVISGAAAYAGLVSTVAPGDSTTNKVLSSIYLATPLRKSQLMALQDAGYVVFEDKPFKGVTVVSGELMTRENSDYDYISTSIAIAETVRELTIVTDPFIGRGIDDVSMSALHTAVTSKMLFLQKLGYFQSSQIRLVQTGPNNVTLYFKIRAKDELREVLSQIKLTRDNLA